jgi:hypothetical protein
MTTSLMTPSVHLNGSSKEHLVEDLCAAGDAVRLAIEKLEWAAPNGRDYYPQGPGAFPQALREHVARVAHLRGVLAELEEIAQAIA